MFKGSTVFFDRMQGAYGNAGVETRLSCVPLEWYLSDHGWPERAALYEEHAVSLLAQAGKTCLADAGIAAQDVAATVTVSSTGVVTPSLDALLLEPLGLPRNVQRLPVFGLGCAGGVLGLSRAATLARAMPGQNILFLCVELCGLTFRGLDTRKSNMIATAIFGDGAVACVLRYDGAPDAKASILQSGEHMWPGTRDIMGWSVENDGLGVIFSRHIPTFVRQEFRSAADDFLADIGLGLDDFDGVLCHPGGEKVIEALEECFDLDPNAMRHARSVLKDRGNMSAVTVVAVLERAIAAGDQGRHLMTALGPGFAAGFAVVDL